MLFFPSQSNRFLLRKIRVISCNLRIVVIIEKNALIRVLLDKKCRHEHVNGSKSRFCFCAVQFNMNSYYMYNIIQETHLARDGQVRDVTRDSCPSQSSSSRVIHTATRVVNVISLASRYHLLANKVRLRSSTFDPRLSLARRATLVAREGRVAPRRLATSSAESSFAFVKWRKSFPTRPGIMRNVETTKCHRESATRSLPPPTGRCFLM